MAGDFGLARVREAGRGFQAVTPVTLPTGRAQPKSPGFWKTVMGISGSARMTAPIDWRRTARRSGLPFRAEMRPLTKSWPWRKLFRAKSGSALYGQGIVAVRAADGRSRRITHDSAVSGGLDSNVVFGLFRDRSGLGWVATPLGLSHVAIGPGIHTLFGHVDARSGLTSDEATALLVRRDGSLWVGSESSGLQMTAPDGSETGKFPIQPVVALAEAPDGRVFAGGRGGLYVIDAQGRHFSRFVVPGRNPTGTVWCLLMRGGALWIGGDDGLSGGAGQHGRCSPPRGTAPPAPSHRHGARPVRCR